MSMTIAECFAKREPRPVPDVPSNVLHQLSLRGKVCVVTGGASGIGLAAAQAFAEAGARAVAIWYNSNPEAERVAQRLQAEHGAAAAGRDAPLEVRAYRCDVADADAVRAAVARVRAELGRIDVFVANSGTSVSKGILDTSVEEYRRLMAVNFDGVVYCAKYAGEVFKEQGSGNFIATSSMSARIVNVPVNQPVYNASKAAVSHFCRSLAVEWREFARVNIVSPGFVDTRMGASPAVLNEAYRMAAMGRQGDVRELKGAFLYLASDASSYATGTELVIDGGYTLP